MNRSVLETLKHFKLNKHPEMSVMLKLLTGDLTPPTKPSPRTYSWRFSSAELEGKTLDKALDGVRKGIQREVETYSYTLDDIVEISPASELNRGVRVTCKGVGNKEENKRYRKDMKLHEKLVALLPDVKLKLEELKYMDEEDKQIALKASIDSLEEQLMALKAQLIPETTAQAPKKTKKKRKLKGDK